MAITLNCSQCFAAMRVPDSAIGKRAKCIKCGTVMLMVPPPVQEKALAAAIVGDMRPVHRPSAPAAPVGEAPNLETKSSAKKRIMVGGIVAIILAGGLGIAMFNRAGGKVGYVQTLSVTTSVSGEVWIQLQSGETLSLASEQILVLPASVPMEKTEPDFISGLEKLEEDIKVAKDLPADNEIAQGQANLAKAEIALLNSHVKNNAVDAVAVVKASSDYIQEQASEVQMFNTINSGAGSSLKESMFSDDVRDEPFWKFITAKSISSVTTSRDGKFVLSNFPPHHYLLACRSVRPAQRAIIYWSVEVDGTKGGTISVELNPSNATVIGY